MLKKHILIFIKTYSMKKSFLAILIFSGFFSFAQAPQGINYQGVARNATGAAMGMQSLGLRFSILQGGSTLVYTETNTVVTDTFGLYNAVIGQGSVTTGTFSAINWGLGNYSVKVEIDPGSGYQNVGTFPLMSVPFSLYSQNAFNSASIQGQPVSGVVPQAGDVLQYNAGIWSPAPPSSTGVLSVGVTAPITNSGTSTAPMIGITQSGAATDGYLSSGDWFNFNNKGNGTVTSVTTGGTTPITITNPTTTPQLTMLPADAATDGYLTKADWTTFNNKGNGTVTSITTGTGLLPTGTTFTNTATISADYTTAIWNAGALQNTILSTTPPTANQVLQFNGTQWEPANIPPGLPAPSIGSILFTDGANTWAPTNPTSIFTDGTQLGIGTNAPGAMLGVMTPGGNTGNAVYINNQGNGYGIDIQNGNGSNSGLHITHPGIGSAAYITTADPTNNADALYVETRGTGNAIKGYTDSNGAGIFGYSRSNSPSSTGVFGMSDSLGSAGVFHSYSPSNYVPALDVMTNGSGYSGVFSGGAGLQTDKIQVTQPSSPPNAGDVLTSMDAVGNAAWMPPAAAMPGGTFGQFMWHDGSNWMGTNTSALYFDGMNLGIGTSTPGSPLSVTSNFGTTLANFTNQSTTGHAVQGSIPAGGFGSVFYGTSQGNAPTIYGNASGSGSAASLSNSNASNTAPVLQVNNVAASTGYSAVFNGGKGVQIDNLMVQDTLNIPLNANPGFVLTSNAVGDATWQAPPAGVTAVNAVSPMSVAGPIASPTISMTQASLGNSGYLSAADWNTFNTKGTVSAVSTTAGEITGGTITTTGTLGLANSGVTPGTYGSASSIPTFTVDAKGRITNITTTAVSTSGTLSGGTANYIPKWLTPTTLSGTSLLYDATTGVGVNTTTVNAILDVLATAAATTPALKAVQANTTNPAGTFTVTNAVNTAPALLVGTSGTGPAIMTNGALNVSNKFIVNTNGNPILVNNVTTNFPAVQGAAGTLLQNDGAGNLSWQPASVSAWSLLGNAGTVDGTNYIGTSDNVALNFRVNNQRAGRISAVSNSNTAFGYQAINNNTGTLNVAFGYTALMKNTTGLRNSAVGFEALQNNLGGASNTAMGFEAMYYNSGGNYNSAFGQDALISNTSGSNNTAVGYESLFTNITNNNNTAVGYYALANSNSPDNTGIGYFGLFDVSSGSNNTGVGNYAGINLFTGSNNTFLGANAGLTNSGTQHSGATAIGANARVDQDNSLVLGSTGVSVGIGTSVPGAQLDITGSSSLGVTLRATNSSTVAASAAFISNTAASNGASVLVAVANGTGPAGDFKINNGGSMADAVIATTNGGGAAVKGSSTGTGNSALFTGGNGMKTDGITLAVKIAINGANTLIGTDYFFVIPAGTGGSVNLPSPIGAAMVGKVYVLKNLGGAAYLLGGGSTYVSVTGVSGQGSIPGSTVIRLISDGSNWQAW